MLDVGEEAAPLGKEGALLVTLEEAVQTMANMQDKGVFIDEGIEHEDEGPLAAPVVCDLDAMVVDDLGDIDTMVEDVLAGCARVDPIVQLGVITEQGDDPDGGEQDEAASGAHRQSSGDDSSSDEGFGWNAATVPQEGGQSIGRQSKRQKPAAVAAAPAAELAAAPAQEPEFVECRFPGCACFAVQSAKDNVLANGDCAHCKHHHTRPTPGEFTEDGVRRSRVVDPFDPWSWYDGVKQMLPSTQARWLSLKDATIEPVCLLRIQVGAVENKAVVSGQGARMAVANVTVDGHTRPLMAGDMLRVMGGGKVGVLIDCDVAYIPHRKHLSADDVQLGVMLFSCQGGNGKKQWSKPVRTGPGRYEPVDWKLFDGASPVGHLAGSECGIPNWFGAAHKSCNGMLANHVGLDHFREAHGLMQSAAPLIELRKWATIPAPMRLKTLLEHAEWDCRTPIEHTHAVQGGSDAKTQAVALQTYTQTLASCQTVVNVAVLWDLGYKTPEELAAAKFAELVAGAQLQQHVLQLPDRATPVRRQVSKAPAVGAPKSRAKRNRPTSAVVEHVPTVPDLGAEAPSSMSKRQAVMQAQVQRTAAEVQLKKAEAAELLAKTAQDKLAALEAKTATGTIQMDLTDRPAARLQPSRVGDTLRNTLPLPQNSTTAAPSTGSNIESELSGVKTAMDTLSMELKSVKELVASSGEKNALLVEIAKLHERIASLEKDVVQYKTLYESASQMSTQFQKYFNVSMSAVAGGFQTMDPAILHSGNTPTAPGQK